MKSSHTQSVDPSIKPRNINSSVHYLSDEEAGLMDEMNTNDFSTVTFPGSSNSLEDLGGVATININGLSSSVSELQKYVLLNKPAILVCTETLVDKVKTLKRKYKVKNYRWIGKDSAKGGRGVACLVHNNIGASISKVYAQLDAFWLKVENKSNVFRIGCAYQPPGTTNVLRSFNEYITDNIMVDEVFFLAGDFNARHVAWCHRTNKAGRYLRDCLSSWGATTLNPPQIPTCTRSNGQSTIDLTLTNQPEWASAAVVGGDLNSDHAPVSTKIIGFGLRAPSPPKRYRFDWNNADWESFSAHIDAATNWSTVKRFLSMKSKGQCEDMVRLDLEDLVVDFNNVVMDAARRYIPTKEMKDFSSQAPYWWEQAHAALLQEKELADKDMREALPGRLRRAAKFRLLRINRKGH